MYNVDFGMPTLIENDSLDKNIELAKSLELKFIELNMNFPEYQIDKLSKWEEFYEKALNAGLYYTIHLDETLNVADFNPLVREAYLETVRRTIEVAKRFLPLNEKFGKKENPPMIINMHMCHGIYITLPDRKVQMYDRDFDIYKAFFGSFMEKVVKWIDGANIRINIENTDGFKEYEKKVVDMLLESECFGLTWDIGHSKAVGEKDVDYILSHKDKLCHMHIHDGSEVPPKNHQALGTGEIDLNSRLGTAGETGSRCVLETKTVEALRESVKWLSE